MFHAPDEIGAVISVVSEVRKVRHGDFSDSAEV